MSLIDLVREGNYMRVRELLQQGGDVNEQDEYRKTPLFYTYNIEMMKLLLEYGADPNIRDKNGRTPLFTVLSIKMMKLLLEYGADPNIRDGYGDILLDHAIKYNSIDEIYLLAIYGAK